MKTMYEKGLKKTKANGLLFYYSETLKGAGIASHAFLTRHGGRSGGNFSSLNLDERGGDEQGNITENLRRVARAFGFAEGSLMLPRQVHGTDVIALEDKGKIAWQKDEGDAVITSLKGVAIGVLTADCAPILFLDPRLPRVAIAHAGWRGTLSDIAGKTIAEMRRLGSDPGDIICAIGPHIRGCCYTIGDDVADAFKERLGRTDRYITHEENKKRLSLSVVNAMLLEKEGVLKENITASSPCTACLQRDFFSYRKNGPSTGRQLSFIMLR